MDTNKKRYTPKHEYLVCIDSDGCAFDTMEIKHPPYLWKDCLANENAAQREGGLRQRPEGAALPDSIFRIRLRPTCSIKRAAGSSKSVSSRA